MAIAFQNPRGIINSDQMVKFPQNQLMYIVEGVNALCASSKRTTCSIGGRLYLIPSPENNGRFG